MSIALVTGSAGLVGAEAVSFFAGRGLEVVGVDNDMRRYFFGDGASTSWNRKKLELRVHGYRHLDLDIRDEDATQRLLTEIGGSLEVVIHAAAQPSHDWAAREPLTDFSVNAVGTLNLLESCRLSAPDAVFIFLSTNKVYGDTPNQLPLVELDKRWEVQEAHPYFEHGIDETMSVDQSLHSLFGASKLAADVLVQEYGRYFGMKSGCFRGGCLTGPGHSGAELHGFLAYLMQCAVADKPYRVFGYKGKQVRDNIHSFDLVNALWSFYRDPKEGEVYNIGGGRQSNCSVLEAITACERRTGRSLNWSYEEQNRVGDHIWWVSDNRKFQSHFPEWELTYDLDRTLDEIHEAVLERTR